MSDKTITIQIGNSDDKLTQARWARFVEDFEQTIHSLGTEVHFFGFSPGGAEWQNCCAVIGISEQYGISLGWDAVEEYIEGVMKYKFSLLTQRYNQDSIAFTVGETEFIGAP